VRARHCWIYRSDLAGQSSAEPGEVVRVIDAHGRALGSALYSSNSQIALRMVSFDDAEISRDFWLSRLDSAKRLRDQIVHDATAFRLVYSDVLGEQSLRCVLEEWAPRALAAELASGWVGDRVSTFGSTEDGALVWELAFDRPERAAAVSSLLVAQLRLPRPRRAPSGAAPLVAEWTCGAHGDSGVVAVDRRGARLVFASLSEIPVSGGCVPLQAWVRAATGAYD